YQTQNGTASSSSDYTATTGDLTFLPGDTTKTIDVPIHGDTTYENDETFTVHLSSPTAATISDADGTGTITNDDAAPTLATGDTTNENDETFTVHLSSPSAATISDADGTGTITNDDGVTLSIADQSKDEGKSGTSNETFTVTLTGSTDVQATVHYQTQNGTAV